jgi:hypothetical protein
MAGVGQSLCNTFDYVWARFTARLEDLDDAEYLWEPVGACWSIHEDGQGIWRMDGVGVDLPPAEPPPITTIAWRIGHVAGMAIGGFASMAFGDGSLTVGNLSVPGRAAQVPEYCAEHYRAWRDGIGAVDEDRWWQPLGEKWGPYKEDSTVDLVLHVLDEVAHHGGEIGLLRDLFVRREQLI